MTGTYLFIGMLASMVMLSTSYDYCYISPLNTLCRFKTTTYGPQCSQVVPLGLTVNDKAWIVVTHNNLRRQVAKGYEGRGYYGAQPPAANMRELSWDDELATMAQTHAQQCTFTHDLDRNVARFKVGQNLAIQFSVKPMWKANFPAMIYDWYNEVVSVDRSFVSRFQAYSLTTTGHYTQLVWGATNKIGCGMVSYYDTAYQPQWVYKILYVCNYGPAGNYINQPMYQIGRAASACPPNTWPNDGLCASAK